MPLTVRMGHTDAAGLVFQAEYFRLLHDAFEDLLDQAGYPLAPVVAAARVGYPLVKVEGEFLAPLRLGDRLTVEVTTEEVGARHFVLSYQVRKGRQVAARGRSVHVAVAMARGRACALPPALARILRRHLAPRAATPRGSR